MAIEGGCNAVASTFGILGSVARKYAHKIPFVVKLNHNELLSYPNSYDQVMFGTVKEAWEMGAVAVGATIYFGSEQSRRQLVEIAEAFDYAHELGMATILWCYLRNNDFKKDGVDYHAAADLTGQADRLGVTIKADIVKQKLPTNNGGFKAIGFGKTDERMYTQLTSEHPIDLCRYQVANGYMGRVGLINSGGESHGASDLRDAVVTAVVNKRAGGMGLIDPVSGKYEIGTPLFPEMKMQLSNGNAFTVLAPAVSRENIYIQSVKLDGKPYDKSYITHEQIMGGATLEFEMGSTPGPVWYK